jgi:hypothetical protein
MCTIPLLRTMLSSHKHTGATPHTVNTRSWKLQSDSMQTRVCEQLIVGHGSGDTAKSVLSGDVLEFEPLYGVRPVTCDLLSGHRDYRLLPFRKIPRYINSCKRIKAPGYAYAQDAVYIRALLSVPAKLVARCCHYCCRKI